MAAFTAVVAVAAAYPAANAPDVTIPFLPKRITIINEDPAVANQVTWSFDGTNDHGAVKPTINPVFTSTSKVTHIWFKRAAGTPNVRVIAES